MYSLFPSHFETGRHKRHQVFLSDEDYSKCLDTLTKASRGLFEKGRVSLTSMFRRARIYSSLMQSRRRYGLASQLTNDKLTSTNRSCWEREKSILNLIGVCTSEYDTFDTNEYLNRVWRRQVAPSSL